MHRDDGGRDDALRAFVQLHVNVPHRTASRPRRQRFPRGRLRGLSARRVVVVGFEGDAVGLAARQAVAESDRGKLLRLRIPKSAA